jgi:hypothetical protein
MGHLLLKKMIKELVEDIQLYAEELVILMDKNKMQRMEIMRLKNIIRENGSSKRRKF